MLTRYDLITGNYGLCDMCEPSVEEHPIGDFLKYDDVVAAIKEAIDDETKDDVVSSLVEAFGICSEDEREA